ncbi:hypothetical protein ACH5RR_028378 [Cinchona calisaya]|uniref:Uncharacterized protein n=1 Tax=Cinchona calisaya TaxID=153742 RepID=A0ABD2YNL1_9GENT
MLLAFWYFKESKVITSRRKCLPSKDETKLSKSFLSFEEYHLLNGLLRIFHFSHLSLQFEHHRLLKK